MPDIQVPDFGANWINALDAGRQRGTQMRQQNALNYAGQAFAAGDYDAAENRLLQAGMPQEAGQYGELAQARRTRTAQRNIAAAGQNATGNPGQRARAMADAALAEGQTDQWAQMLDASRNWTQGQIQLAQQTAQLIASRAPALKQLPMEQRTAAAIQELQSIGADESAIERIRQLGADGLTDAEIDAETQGALSFAEQLTQRNNERDFNEQRRQFGLSYGLEARRTAAAEREASGVLPYPQLRVAVNQHNSNIRAIEENLGILRPALPYANLITRTNGDEVAIQQGGMTGTDMRVADTGLLRGAARSQTGPGVLTQPEVLQTLTPTLQSEIRRQGQFFDPNSVSLAAADRVALSRLVIQAASDTSRQAWQQYDSSLAILPPGQDSAAFNTPTLPHWEDMGQLNSPNGDYQLGRDYITRGGRRYTYATPGNWVYRGRQAQPQQPAAASQPQQPTSFATMTREQLERYSPQQITAMTPQQRAAFIARANQLRGQ